MDVCALFPQCFHLHFVCVLLFLSALFIIIIVHGSVAFSCSGMKIPPHTRTHKVGDRAAANSQKHRRVTFFFRLLFPPSPKYFKGKTATPPHNTPPHPNTSRSPPLPSSHPKYCVITCKEKEIMQRQCKRSFFSPQQRFL